MSFARRKAGWVLKKRARVRFQSRGQKCAYYCLGLVAVALINPVASQSVNFSPQRESTSRCGLQKGQAAANTPIDQLPERLEIQPTNPVTYYQSAALLTDKQRTPQQDSALKIRLRDAEARFAKGEIDHAVIEFQQ